jgi:hypothetical protein
MPAVCRLLNSKKHIFWNSKLSSESWEVHNPEVTREQKIQLRKKFEGVCKEMGVKSEVYSSMFSGK